MYFFKDRFKNTHNTDTAIGLDIGSRTIKWVCLDRNNELKEYAIQTIPTPIGVEQTKDIPQIAAVLKETLLDKDHIRNCIVNIPDILVCSKLVKIDSADCQHIEEIIELLVEQSIPYPLCKIYFDYQIFDPLPENQEHKVLLVACRKDHLDFRLDIIQQANLIPIAVEVGSFALERACCYFYPDKINENVILLDLGASQLTLLFFNGSQTMVYCENLANVFEYECILLQIKQCIKRYALAYPYLILKELFLIGINIALLNYLLNTLDGFLELQVRLLKYPNSIKCSPIVDSDKLAKNFLSLFLSYGLALRTNLNF
ncbi:type IV pilus biogenesis protein PilM [Rickettsiella endosymbiont of Xylota segnis]|uniref:type IV pilus biogenesis protein PilM n=1 Tax=Rickettsiella endosymbiont of Xylota segnis TaxID=3066238 RepID=UPI0030D4D9F1